LPKMLVSQCGVYLAEVACQPVVFILPKKLVSLCGVYLVFHACQPLVFILTLKMRNQILFLPSPSLLPFSLFPTCFGFVLGFSFGPI